MTNRGPREADVNLLGAAEGERLVAHRRRRRRAGLGAAVGRDRVVEVLVAPPDALPGHCLGEDLPRERALLWICLVCSLASVEAFE